MQPVEVHVTESPDGDVTAPSKPRSSLESERARHGSQLSNTEAQMCTANSSTVECTKTVAGDQDPEDPPQAEPGPEHKLPTTTPAQAQPRTLPRRPSSGEAHHRPHTPAVRCAVTDTMSGAAPSSATTDAASPTAGRGFQRRLPRSTASSPSGDSSRPEGTTGDARAAEPPVLISVAGASAEDRPPFALGTLNTEAVPIAGGADDEATPPQTQRSDGRSIGAGSVGSASSPQHITHAPGSMQVEEHAQHAGLGVGDPPPLVAVGSQDITQPPLASPANQGVGWTTSPVQRATTAVAAASVATLSPANAARRQQGRLGPEATTPSSSAATPDVAPAPQLSVDSPVPPTQSTGNPQEEPMAVGQPQFRKSRAPQGKAEWSPRTGAGGGRSRLQNASSRTTLAEVIPHRLYLGSFAAVCDTASVQRAGVSAFVCCAQELPSHPPGPANRHAPRATGSSAAPPGGGSARPGQSGLPPTGPRAQARPDDDDDEDNGEEPPPQPPRSAVAGFGAHRKAHLGRQDSDSASDGQHSPVGPAAPFYHLKMQDTGSQQLVSLLGPLWDFLDSVWADGRAVAVYCMRGISRSGAVAVAAYMRFYQVGYTQAIEGVRRVRREVDPNFGFCLQLEQLGAMFEEEKKLRQRAWAQQQGQQSQPQVQQPTGQHQQHGLQQQGHQQQGHQGHHGHQSHQGHYQQRGQAQQPPQATNSTILPPVAAPAQPDLSSSSLGVASPGRGGSPQSVSLHNTTNNLTPQQSLTGQQSLNVPGTMDFMNTLRSYQSLESVSAASPYPAQSLAESRRGSQSHGGSGSVWPVPQQVPAAFGHRTVPSPSPQNSQGHQHFTGGTGGFFTSNDSSPQHGMQSAVYQAQITPKGFVIQPLQHHHQSDGDPGLSRHGLGAQSAPAGAPQFARHGAPDSGRSGRSRSGSLSQSGAPPGGWSASVVSGQPLLSDRYMGVRSNSLGSDLFSGGLSCASVPISVVSVPTMGGVPMGFGSSPGASLPMSGPTSGAASSGPAGLSAALASGTQFLPPVLSAQVAATLQSPRSTTTAGTTTGTKSSMSNASGTGSFLLQQQREASPGQVSASANPAGSPQSQPGVPSNHTTTTTTTTATTTTASGASGVGHSSQLPPVPQKGSPDRRRASSIVQLGPQHSVSHRGSRPSLGPVPGSQMSLLGNAGSQLSLHPQGSNLFAQQQGQSPTLKSVPSFGGQSLHSAQSTLSTGSFINASNARLGPQAQGQPQGQLQGQQQDPQPVQGFGRGQQQQGSQHQLLPQPQQAQQTGGVAFPGNFAANVVPPSAPAEPPAAVPAVTYHRNSMQSLDGSALVSPMTSVRGHHLLSASTSHSNTPQTVSPVRRQSLQNNVLALYGARSGAGAGGAPGLHSQRHSPAVSSSPARSAVLNASSSHAQGNQPGEQEGSQPGFDSVAGFSGYDFGLPSVHRVSAQPTPAQTPEGTAHMLLSVDTARSLGGGTVQSYATSGLSGPAVGAANFGAFQVPAHARGAGNFGASLPGGWSPSQVSAPGSRSGGSVAAVPIDTLQSGHVGHPFRSGGASINEHSSNRSWNASMAEAGTPQQWPQGSLTTPMGGSVSPGRPAQLSFSETPSIAAPSSSRTMTTSSAFGTQHSPQTGSTVSGFGSDRFQAQPRGPDWSTTALTTGHVRQPTLVMARVPSLGTSSNAAQSIRPQLSVSPATLPPAMQGQGSAFPQEPRAEFTMNVAHAKAPFSSSTPPEAEPTQPIPGASPVGAPLFQRLSVGDATGLGGPTTRQMSGGTAAPTPQSPVSAVGDAVPGPSSVCSPNMPRESSAAAATAGPGSAVQQDLKHFPSGSHDSGSSSSHRPRTEGGSGDAPMRQSSLRSSLGQFVSQSDSDDDTAIPLSSVARRIHAARHSARRLSDHEPPHRSGSMPESNGSPRPPSICSFSSVGGLAAHPGNRSGANRGSALENDDAMSFTSRRLAQLQRTETLPAMDDTAVDRILREEADRRRDLDAALRSTDLVESVIVQHRGSDSTSTVQARLSSSEAAPAAGSSAGDGNIIQPLSAIRAVGSSSSMASPPNPTAVGLSNARAALPDLAQRSRDPSDAAAGTSSRRSEGRAPSLGTTAPGALGVLTSSTASFSPSPPRASIATNPRDGTGLGGLTGSSMALAGMTMSSEGTDRRTSTNTARTVRPEQQQALVPTPTGSSATPPPTDARRPATEREGIVSLHPESLGAEGEDGRHSAHGDSAASDPNLRSSNDGSTSPQARTVQRLLRALSSAQAHDDDPSEHSEGLTSGRWSAQRGLAGSELTPRRSDSGLISRDGSVSVGKRQSSEIPPLPPTGLALQRARSMSSQSDAESPLHHTDTNNTTVGTTSLPPLGGPRSRSPSEMVESGAVSPVARVPLPAMVPETTSGAPSPLHQGGEVKRGTLRPSKQRHSSGGQQ